MVYIKDYIGNYFVGKKFRFKCTCLISFDFEGEVKGYKIKDTEIVLQVDRGQGKLIDIGLNHPKLNIDEIN